MGVDVSKGIGRWCVAAGGDFVPAFCVLLWSGVPP